MKIEEINKIKIGDLVNIHHTSPDTNSVIKLKNLLIDKIEHYPSGGVQIIKTGFQSFKWWEVHDIFTKEEYPEMFI